MREILYYAHIAGYIEEMGISSPPLSIKKMLSTAQDEFSAPCQQYYTLKFQAKGSQRSPLPLLTKI